jgi:DNA polymerase
MFYNPVMQSDPSHPTENDPDAFAALLEWYAAVGVDLALADAPVDRFAESAAQMASAARPAAPALSRQPPPHERQAAPTPAAPMAAASPATIPNAETVMSARAAAASAASLDELKGLLEGFEGCNLRLTAKNLVFGDGVATAPLMLIGEAPGRDEDIEGRPFVGRSGQLLDRMLAAVGMSRTTNAYIANVIYWRPPGNRDPSDLEIAVCRPFILRQIELVDPRVIVFLGNQPARALLGGDVVRQGINKLRGHWCELETGGKRYRALPTFHPAYLLRSPIKKREAWRDFLDMRAALAAEPG